MSIPTDDRRHLTFLTTVSGRHERFVAPFITAALTTHPDAFCELHGPELHSWRDRNPEIHKGLEALFPGQFEFYGVPARFAKAKPAGDWRWLLHPSVFADYTYIGDVDVLHCDRELLGAHKRNMQLTGKPYSNRLVGAGMMATRQCVHTLPYYLRVDNKLVDGLLESRKTGSYLLFDVLVNSHGLPKQRVSIPYHGPNISLNNQPKTSYRGWKLGKTECRDYVTMAESKQWRHMLPLFPMEYQVMLSRMHEAFARLGYNAWKNR